MAEEKKTVKKPSGEFIATGRRKSSIARVRMQAGKGKITVNDREIGEYLQRDTLLLVALQPLELTGTREKFDIRIKCDGGGISVQSATALLVHLLKQTKLTKQNLKPLVS